MHAGKGLQTPFLSPHCLAVTLIALVTFAPWRPVDRQTAANVDTAGYVTPAENLARGRGFTNVATVTMSVPGHFHAGTIAPETLRTPGYPLLLALFVAAGLPVELVVVFQRLLDVALAVLLCAWATRLTGRPRLGVLAAILFVAHLPTVRAAGTIMTETLAAAVLTIAALLLSFALERESRFRFAALAAAGFLVGFAVLVRPIAVLLFVPLTLVVASLGSRGVRMRASAIFLASSLLLPTCWSVRNYVRAGVMTVSSAPGENALFFRAAGTLVVADRGLLYGAFALQRNHDFFYRMVHIRPALFERVSARIRAAGEDPEKLTHAQLAVWYAKEGGSILASRPLDFAKLMFSGAFRVLFDAYWETAAGALDYRKARIVLIPASMALLAFAILGLRDLWSHARPTAAIIAVTVAYFVLFSAGPDAEPRFSVPFAPLICIAEAAGILSLARKRPSSP